MKLAVGVFVIVFSVLLLVLTYVILQKKGVFEEKLSYHFYTQSAESLHIGMPVHYSGFEIGAITNIKLTESGAVLVNFDVKKEHVKWIRRNTVLRLEKPLIGSPSIDVLTTMESPELEAGSSLSIVVQDDINDIINKIEPVIKDLQNIVISVNTMTEKLASDEGDLFVTLKHLETYSDKLVEDNALLTTLTGDPESTQQLKTSLAEAEQTLTSLHAMAADLNRSVIVPSDDVMQQLDTILKDVSHKLQTLEGTVEAIGSYDTDLIELKGDIRAGVNKATNLIDRVNTMLGDEKPAEAPLP